MDCSETIEKEVCVEAKVKVKPETETGEVELRFVGGPKREYCEGALFPDCDFILSQMICLRIPVMFSADAEVVRQGIVCEKKNRDCEPRPCDDEQEHWEYMVRRGDRESDPAKSYARNILLTYRNNRER